jgi:PKD repeat protein
MQARQRRLEPGLGVRPVGAPRAARGWRCALALACLASAGAAAPIAAGTSTASSPTITFAAKGLKDVTLTACNYKGCTTVHQQIMVLEPRPAVSFATITSAFIEVGQIARLNGAATGQPPLAFSWQLSSAGLAPAPPVATLSGATPYLDVTGFAPGAYTAVLVVQNGSGSAQSAPVPFTVIPSQPEGFYTVPPCRVYDSRASGGAPLASSVLQTINVGASGCGIPSSARAIAASFTVVGPTDAGNVALFPANYPQPATSNVNFASGQTRNGNGVLGLASDGSLAIAAAPFVAGNGTVHLIVDVTGYFKP